MESCFHKPAKRIMDALLLLILGRRTREDPLSGKISFVHEAKLGKKKKGFPRNKNENFEHCKDVL